MSITDELREYASFCPGGMGGDALRHIADRIDERYHRDMATAQQVGINEGEDAAMRDGWVRKDKEHIISHATIEVTPHIDWSRMADELDEFVEIVRGMAGGAE